MISVALDPISIALLSLITYMIFSQEARIRRIEATLIAHNMLPIDPAAISQEVKK
jgi:hypothetical protein